LKNGKSWRSETTLVKFSVAIALSPLAITYQNLQESLLLSKIPDKAKKVVKGVHKEICKGRTFNQTQKGKELQSE